MHVSFHNSANYFSPYDLQPRTLACTLPLVGWWLWHDNISIERCATFLHLFISRYVISRDKVNEILDGLPVYLLYIVLCNHVTNVPIPQDILSHL